MLSSLILASTILISVVSVPAGVVEIDPIEIVLDKLRICESSGRAKAINIMDGDASSFGAFQFKIKTFVWAGRRYGLEHSDIWSESQQRAIAKVLILDGRGEQHWKNCWEKMNLSYERR